MTTKLPRNLSNDRWILGNEEDATTPATLGFWIHPCFYEVPQIAGCDSIYHIFEFQKDHMRLFLPEKHTLKQTSKILSLVLRRPDYHGEWRKKVVAHSDNLYAFSKALGRLNFATLSDPQLLKIIKQHELLIYKILGYGMASAFMEIPYGQLTQHILDFLEKRSKELKLQEPVSDYFSKLSAITEGSVQREELKGSYVLLSRFKNKKIADKFLRQHISKYAWAYYGYRGPAMTKTTLLKNLRHLAKEVPSPDQALRRLNRESGLILSERKKAEKSLKLNKNEKAVFRVLRDAVFMKLYRRDAMSFSFYMMGPVIGEFARRAGISPAEASCIVPGEYSLMLADKSARKQLRDRLDYCNIPSFTIHRKGLMVLQGSAARDLVKRLYKEEKVKRGQELRGQVACVGKKTITRGKVKIINVPGDMKKMKAGDILVSQATSPEIVTAMKKAAAIVTEQGGITSHASIVSRELNISCIIGTKIATKAFKDGDAVEVDTHEGTVTMVKNKP